MDPNNERAKEGIERVEKQSDMLRMDATYDVDNEDMDGSENEVGSCISETSNPIYWLPHNKTHDFFSLIWKEVISRVDGQTWM